MEKVTKVYEKGKKVLKIEKVVKLFLIIAVFCAMLPASVSLMNAVETDVVILDNTSDKITYSAGNANNGGWSSWGDSENYVTSEHWSNSANATMSFSFTGTKLELYGKKDPTHAMFTVSIDGVETEHDEYASTTTNNSLIYESPMLSSGNHNVVVEVLGKRNEASMGTGNVYGFQFTYAKLFADAKLEMETVVTTVDNATIGTGINQFDFSSHWTNDTNAVAHDGTEHWTNKGTGDPGRWGEQPTVTIKFKGNKIEIFGQKESTGGIYNAVIDGNEETAEEFSTYKVGNKQPQELLYLKEGLAEGEHTLKLTILKKFEATAGSSYADKAVSGVIDYAKITSLEKVNVDKTYETKVDNVDTTTTNEMFKYQFEGPGWTQGTGSSLFYKGTEAYANSANANKAFYSIKFIGSGVKIIASKNTAHANYDVFIDDVKVGEAIAKLPSGAAQHGKTIFEKLDIEHGEHTLKVAVKAGSAGAIQADAVFITHKAIPPTSITFDKEALSVEAGLTGNVKATMGPSYATGSIEYTVDDQGVATISNTGEVSAIKAGSATITATVKGTSVSTSIPLTVTPEGLPLAISVGDANFLATQDHYTKVLTQAKTSWSDVVWRGDVLNSKIDLASKKTVSNVKITATDFTSGSDTISKSNIEINWLKETLANIGRGNSGAPVKPFPDVIHKDASEPLDIDIRKVQSAWININIPKTAKPGVYTGKITVSANELEDEVELNYTFEVLDLVQPDPKDMDTQVQIWQHPFAVANYYKVDKADYFKEPHLKYMRESMKEYASLGGKDVVANIVEEAWGHQSYTGDPTMVQWIKKSDGTMDFNYDLFDKWIQFNIDCGVLDPAKGIGQIKCFSIIPWEDKFYYYDEASGKNKTEAANPGSPLWNAMWTAFLTDFMDHVEEKGWFDITYISLDERPMNRVGPAVDLIKSITNKSGKPFKISSAFNYQSGSDYSFLDKIDDISIGLSHVNDESNDMKKMAAHRKEKGLLTTIYTCTGDYPGNFTISDPVDNAWCMWYTMTQNTDGYMKWAWDNWVEDPLVNVNYKYWEPGDGWFIYPTEKGKQSDTYYYKTPRYEMLKQGTRDINKAKYIMENSETLGVEVDALVKSLKRPNAGGNGYGSAVPKTEADRALAGSEVVRMREGINAIARKYIAEKTILVTEIKVDQKTVSLEVGETVTVTTTVLPENATDKTLAWTSSNEEIATVKDGVISAIKAGEATITIENVASGIKKEIRVTTKDKVIVPEENKEITNSTGDISVFGKFPSSVTIATTVMEGKEEKEIINKIKEKNEKFFSNNKIEKIIDIELLDGTLEYTPNGLVVVKIKLVNNLVGKDLKVYYVDEDGTLSERKLTVKDGYISFETRYLSKFAIASEIKIVIEDTDDDKSSATAPGQNTTQNRQQVTKGNGNVQVETPIVDKTEENKGVKSKKDSGVKKETIDNEDVPLAKANSEENNTLLYVSVGIVVIAALGLMTFQLRKRTRK